tara:strand:- start:276 stop:1616 length:1341 start_codon:yes stop_codon:yes gene_type:complete
MPSTFTSNTGIEKIADGEQSGAWGETTNDNFDIVDRALNGSVSITLSGTTGTVTTSDGILSDGQYAVLIFAGSPSGTNTVTIAPNTAQKTYLVRNTTAQSVVLTQGSGGNVTVPAGRSAAVYADGGGAAAAVVDISAGLVPVLTNAGVTSSTAELNILDGVTSSTAELNLVDGSVAGTVVNSKAVVYGAAGQVNATTLQIAGVSVTSTAAELNFVDGVTSNVQTQLDAKQALNARLTEVSGLAVTDGNFIVGNGSAFVAEAPATALLSLGVTSTAAELNILDGVTATAAELNILDGVTSTTAELNILDGVTSTTAELNILDGLTGVASQAEAEAGSDNATLMTPLRVEQNFAANEQQIGVAQSWQVVTRSAGVWYQNTTGRPIGVYALGSISSGVSWDIGVSTVSFVTISMADGDSGDSADYGWIIVPVNHYYRNTGLWNNPRELR